MCVCRCARQGLRGTERPYPHPHSRSGRREGGEPAVPAVPCPLCRPPGAAVPGLHRAELPGRLQRPRGTREEAEGGDGGVGGEDTHTRDPAGPWGDVPPLCPAGGTRLCGTRVGLGDGAPFCPLLPWGHLASPPQLGEESAVWSGSKTQNWCRTVLTAAGAWDSGRGDGAFTAPKIPPSSPPRWRGNHRW